METHIRKATEADIEPILEIINGYAAQNLMLPRTPEQIRRVLPKFLVAEQTGRIVGCGSNVELTPRLTELRSLAVAQDQRGTGLGRRLVHALVEQARADGYDQICALTLSEEFFNRCGFTTVDRWSISPKIWHECVFCPKFDACDEIAVALNLTETAPALASLAPEVSLKLWQALKLGRLQMLRQKV
ncbi:MAG: Amino-acid acetyltransferase [Chloroflexi bacterium ADurb.Bin325]|nr:MAG: Amino-acid acetyltransferase [Chloroflexi bacterium ADurb.Bin325]